MLGLLVAVVDDGVVGHGVVGNSVVGGVVDHGGSMVDSMVGHRGVVDSMVGHRGSMMNSMVHRGSMVDSMCAMVHSMGSVDRAWQQISKTHMNL